MVRSIDDMIERIDESSALVDALIKGYAPEARLALLGPVIDSVAADFGMPVAEVYAMMAKVATDVENKLGMFTCE